MTYKTIRVSKKLINQLVTLLTYYHYEAMREPNRWRWVNQNHQERAFNFVLTNKIAHYDIMLYLLIIAVYATGNNNDMIELECYMNEQYGFEWYCARV